MPKPIELNATELKMVKLICKEYNAKEIASRMDLSFRTVEDYRNKIRKKVKAKSLVGIALWAVKNEIIKI
jgi:DNA-binding CsgD family transcriptional regulator